MSKDASIPNGRSGITVPTRPSTDTLEEMARRFDSAFDLPSVSKDGDSVGYSEADKQEILARMERVYRAAIGLAEPVRIDPEADRPSAWFRNDWMRSMPPVALEAFLRGFMGIAPRHWRPAVTHLAGQGFPVVLHNENIGTLLAERTEDVDRHGFYPYVAGLEEDGYRWPIQDENLERWRLAPLPGTARGWIELFRDEGSPPASDDDRATVEPILAAIEQGVADRDEARTLDGIARFFDVLGKKRV